MIYVYLLYKQKVVLVYLKTVWPKNFSFEIYTWYPLVFLLKKKKKQPEQMFNKSAARVV